LDNITKLTAYL